MIEAHKINSFYRGVSSQQLEVYDSFAEQNSYNTSSINSFWNYCNSAATLLKTSLYQLAPSASSNLKFQNLFN